MRFVTPVLFAAFLSACGQTPTEPEPEVIHREGYRWQDRDATISREGGNFGGAAYRQEGYVHTLHYAGDSAGGVGGYEVVSSEQAESPGHGQPGIDPFNGVKEIEENDGGKSEVDGNPVNQGGSPAANDTGGSANQERPKTKGRAVPDHTYTSSEMGRWRRWCDGTPTFDDINYVEANGRFEGIPASLQASCNPTFK
jgi:hypothetical protein